MTQEEFERLVARLEQQAQSHPDRYTLKVLLLAALGNAYLFSILLLLLALLAGLAVSLVVLKALAAKLIVAVGIFVWMILKALRIRIDPPQGAEISANEAPELFAMIDDLRRRLGTSRFHHVLITDDFNAGVVQSPRLGIFGWPRNYLLIGLPLMKALSGEQFKAVLAHEFGHLARGHGRVSNWIYRQRLRWSRLLAALEENESRGRFLFMPFLRWFAPYFNAYSFPLARANEYQADATAVQLTSPHAAAEALTGVNVVGAFLAEHYWPNIHAHADDQPHPRFTPYLELGQRIATQLDSASANTWMDQAMARQTDSADTHPALSDRLAAIGGSPRFVPPEAGQSADRLLGAALDSITESFDQRWRDNILPAWQDRHHEVRKSRQRLSELNARLAEGAELTPQELFDHACLTERAGRDPEAALSGFRALHERFPDDPLICYHLGIRLLSRDDVAGVALVERAMELDEGAIVAACEQLRDYHWRNGRKEEAHAFHQRMVERWQLQDAAAKERNHVLLKDRFEPHGLSAEAVADLLRELQAVPDLRKAYLVKKRVKHFPERPAYVFGFRITRWFGWHNKGRAQEIAQNIQSAVSFPGETLIINVEGDNRRFGWKFSRTRGARIL